MKVIRATSLVRIVQNVSERGATLHQIEWAFVIRRVLYDPLGSFNDLQQGMTYGNNRNGLDCAEVDE